MLQEWLHPIILTCSVSCGCSKTSYLQRAPTITTCGVRRSVPTQRSTLHDPPLSVSNQHSLTGTAEERWLDFVLYSWMLFPPNCIEYHIEMDGHVSEYLVSDTWGKYTQVDWSGRHFKKGEGHWFHVSYLVVVCMQVINEFLFGWSWYNNTQ